MKIQQPLKYLEPIAKRKKLERFTPNCPKNEKAHYAGLWLPHPGDLLKFRSRKYKSYWNVKTETVLDQNENTSRKLLNTKSQSNLLFSRNVIKNTKYDTKSKIWYKIQNMIQYPLNHSIKYDRRYKIWLKIQIQSYDVNKYKYKIWCKIPNRALSSSLWRAANT